MKKRITAMLLVVLMTTAIFAGCGADRSREQVKGDSSTTEAAAKPSKPERVTIKYMQNSANGGREEVLKSMIKDFQSKFNHITVDYEIVAWKDYYTKLNTLIAAGSGAPDVFEVGYENFTQYAKAGLLKDLTSVIAKDNEFQPDNIKKLALKAYSFDGKQMGLPTSFTGVVMYYNKDLFDSKGVPYPSENWTWKDELEAAIKLTDASKGIWGTIAPLQEYEFYKTIVQNGGSVWGPDGSVTINSKECVEALQWMLDKSNKHKIQPLYSSDIMSQPDADWRAFESGKVAMIRQGIWQFGEFQKNAKCNWDIVLEPGNTQKGHHFFSEGLVIGKGSAKADAAWTFLKYNAIDSFVTNTRIKEGWNVPVVNNEEIMSAYYQKTPPQNKKAVTGILDSLVLPPLGPIPDKWNDIANVIKVELEKAKLGKVTAKEALDAAKINLEKLVK